MTRSTSASCCRIDRRAPMHAIGQTYGNHGSAIQNAPPTCANEASNLKPSHGTSGKTNIQPTAESARPEPPLQPKHRHSIAANPPDCQHADAGKAMWHYPIGSYPPTSHVGPKHNTLSPVRPPPAKYRPCRTSTNVPLSRRGLVRHHMYVSAPSHDAHNALRSISQPQARRLAYGRPSPGPGPRPPGSSDQRVETTAAQPPRRARFPPD